MEEREWGTGPCVEGTGSWSEGAGQRGGEPGQGTGRAGYVGNTAEEEAGHEGEATLLGVTSFALQVWELVPWQQQIEVPSVSGFLLSQTGTTLCLGSLWKFP